MFVQIAADMLEKRHHDEDNRENLVPNSHEEMTNSMKRPKPASRNVNDIKDTANADSSLALKSYNPNRKLKRNRNS